MSNTSKPVRQLYDAEQSTERQRQAFLRGRCPVAVYGLGKMGLPLAAVFADITGRVIGADIDPDTVETVNEGQCPVKSEPGLDELVARCVDTDALQATTDPVKAANQARIHVIIVPTPITADKEPDLSALDSVVADIGAGLEAGDQVLVECTVPPRTTVDHIYPQLSEAAGLDQDSFGLAFCPERTSSGRALEDIQGAYPKVVGGVDEESTDTAELIYDEINDAGVIAVSDATTAECVKVFEGLYRDVNIALANELSTFTDEFGIDVNEAIDVANTQPFCDIHDPGPGVGGHCIPFYPYFVINPFETDAPLLETARTVNDSMPSFTVEKLLSEFAAEGVDPETASVLLLGLTYREGVEEIRASPSIAIAEELAAAGVDVSGVDPLLDEYSVFSLTPLELSEMYGPDFDGIVLVTPHEAFDDIEWNRLGREGGSVVIDGRQSLDIADTAHRVYTIGSGHTG